MQQAPAAREPSQQTNGLPRDAMRAGLLLLAFSAVALICRESLRGVGEGPRLGFPSFGLAIAAFVALGGQGWLLVLICALLTASFADLGLPFAMLLALGQSLAALGAAGLLRRALPIHPQLHHIRDLLRFLLVGAATAAVSATLAAHTIPYLPTRNPPALWLTWWASDTLSVALLGAPALILLDSRRPIIRPDLRYWSHLAAFVTVAAVLLTQLYFRTSSALLDLLLRPYLIFPLVIWAAFSFDRKVAALATALLVFGILHGSLEPGTGLLLSNPLHLLRLWAICILVMTTGLSATQLIDENRRAMAAIDHSRKQATQREAELRNAHEAAQRLASELEQRERLMRTLYDTTSVGICVINGDGRVSHVNQRMVSMFGYPLEEITGMEYGRLVHQEQRSQGQFSIRALLQQETDLVEKERHYVRRDGSDFWGHVMGRPLVGEDGSATGVVVTIADISLQHEADKNQRLSAKVFESSNEGIVITDAQHNILQVNQAFTRITGYAPEDVLGHMPNALSSPMESESFYQRMHESLMAEGRWNGEVTDQRKNGEIYTEWLSINAVRDENQTVTNYVAVFSDVTEHKRDEARIRHLAQYDYLTDLPNRAALYERLRQIHASAERYQRQYGVIFLDLDNFKPINDEYGHDTGDTLLRQVSQRLRDNVRAADTVARHGGDEFVILVPELQNAEEARSLADKLLAILGQPYLIANRLLTITPSIGIALYPDHGVDTDSLVRAADLAMYEAKHRGRNKVVVANRADLCNGTINDNAATRN